MLMETPSKKHSQEPAGLVEGSSYLWGPIISFLSLPETGDDRGEKEILVFLLLAWFNCLLLLLIFPLLSNSAAVCTNLTVFTAEKLKEDSKHQTSPHFKFILIHTFAYIFICQHLYIWVSYAVTVDLFVLLSVGRKHFWKTKACAKQFEPTEVIQSLENTVYEKKLGPGLLQSRRDWWETQLLLSNGKRLLE